MSLWASHAVFAFDCELAKRNARLAEALGISDESRERAIRHLAGGPVVYSDEVMSFAKDDSKFVLLAEKTFAEFIASNKRSQVLPHMTQEKRKFVHSLAGIYRLDTQMVDQEPLRSIQILRRLDSRIPAPLLSAAMASSVGKLGLSSSSSSAWRAPSKPVSPAPAPPVPGITASGARGWGAIVNPRSTGVTVPPTIITSTSTPVPRATNIPSRSATPSLGVRVESMSEMQSRGENMDVPDNWEDDV
ncbi:hypothetical protein APHAL10511_003264 [Amanita phalloides]|nr:hypothetical protein APHAL10511_003264 [Amanita phalloides]